MTPDDALRRALTDALTDDEFRELLELSTRNGTLDEGQLLEFKGRKSLEKDDAPALLRRYVTGFANAEGGLLVFGVEKDGTRSGCPQRIGRTTIRDWPETCLADKGTQLVPFPRAHLHRVDGLDFLVVATARAPRLVACRVGNDEVYFYRMGTTTRRLPTSLLIDLQLGRREHPVLEITSVRASIVREHVRCGDLSQLLAVSLTAELQNVGLLKAKRVLMGLISWTSLGLCPTCRDATFWNGSTAADMPHINEFLARHIDATPFDELEVPGFPTSSYTRRLAHGFATFTVNERPGFTETPRRLNLEPFREPIKGAFPTFNLERPQHRWPRQAALYILPQGAPPTWHQLTLSLRGETQWSLDVQCSPVFGLRPRIGP